MSDNQNDVEFTNHVMQMWKVRLHKKEVINPDPDEKVEDILTKFAIQNGLLNEPKKEQPKEVPKEEEKVSDFDINDAIDVD